MRYDARRRSLVLVLVVSMAVYAVASKTSGSGIKCSQQQVKDDQRTGIVAFTYLMPKGWTSNSSFNWNGNTYVADFGAATPDKQYVVDHLEPVNMNYTEGSGMNPQGLRITHATDFLHALVNRLEQQGGASNVRVVEEFDTELPLTDIQKQILSLRTIGGMSHSAFHETAYMKINFERNGIEETADLVTTVAGNLQANNMVLGFGPTQRTVRTENDSNIVGPSMLVIAPSKPSAAKLKEAQIIASSSRMTPSFALFCAKTALAMADASARAGAERTKQLQVEIENQTAKSMADFKNRMAQRDANTHDFCNYLLDQQDYHAPGGGIVTLPSNYDHAWANGDGEYVLTNDPTYDPRGTDSSNWQQVTKAEHGH